MRKQRKGWTSATPESLTDARLLAALDRGADAADAQLRAHSAEVVALAKVQAAENRELTARLRALNAEARKRWRGPQNNSNKSVDTSTTTG